MLWQMVKWWCVTLASGCTNSTSCVMFMLAAPARPTFTRIGFTRADLVVNGAAVS